MSDPSPRHSRRGLVIPFLIVGLILVAWTGWWFYLVGQIQTRLDLQAEALRGAGWTVKHARPEITGWPFRARVQLDHAEILAPSGLGVAMPVLVAEANAYRPDRWVVVAPEGLTLRRPGKGGVGVRGDAIRLSVSGLTGRFPDLRVELARPVFTAQADAEPFPIASAELIRLETRPHLTDGEARTDEMDVLFQMTDARGRRDGPVEGLTRQGRLSLGVEAVIEGASRLSGADSAGVFHNWTRGGGQIKAVQGRVEAGESRAQFSSDQLYAGRDGRLRGTVAVQAVRPGAAISGLAGSSSGAVDRVGATGAAAATAVTGDPDMALTVIFRDGRTWLGPFALAPAPKLF